MDKSSGSPVCTCSLFSHAQLGHWTSKSGSLGKSQGKSHCEGGGLLGDTVQPYVNELCGAEEEIPFEIGRLSGYYWECALFRTSVDQPI